MTMVMALDSTETLDLDTYSPVTLGVEWSRMGRFMFLLGLSILGTVMNGYFIASFFVERSLRRVGHVFLACIGIADLMITTAIMPTGVIILLSGQWDTEPVCNALHFVALTSTYSYTSFFMMVSIENYYTICRPAEEYPAIFSAGAGLLSCFIFVMTFALAGIGVYLQYDYNYCTRRHYGNIPFRSGTALLFHVIPFIITMIALIATSVYVQRRARRHVQYKRSQVFECDSSSSTLNIIAYLFYVASWIPYLIIVNEYPGSSDAYFYHCVWLGLSRSVFSTFIYAFFNRNFRRAFAHLFNYCCCKNTLSSSNNVRHRRAMEYRSTAGEIRVHIMHHAIQSGSRYYSSYRETHDL